MRPQTGKKKLFKAGMALFETQGYFSTTIEQIAQKAGVSKGLVYNYFPSKDAFLVALLEEGTQQMEAVAETLAPAMEPQQSLEEFMDHFFTFLKKEKAFLKLQLTLMLMPELQEVVGKSQRRRAKLLLDKTHDWFLKKGLEQPLKKARCFLALLDGVALHYLCIFQKYPLNSVKETVVKTALDLCQSSEKGKPSWK